MNYKAYNQMLGMISKTYIFEIVPLDLVLHFFVGMIISMIVVYYKKSPLLAMIITSILAFIKEFNDYFVLESVLSEQVLDFIFTILFSVLLFLIKWIKKCLNNKINND